MVSNTARLQKRRPEDRGAYLQGFRAGIKIAAALIDEISERCLNTGDFQGHADYGQLAASIRTLQVAAQDHSAGEAEK